MLFILIGVLLAILIAILFVHFDWEAAFAILLCMFFLVAGVLLGLFCNTGGYQPVQEIRTYELQSLTDRTASVGHGSLFYVSVGAENTFTFYVEVNSEFKTEGSKAYASRTISGEKDVTIIEEKKCAYPRLTIYQRKPIATLWSFAIWSDVTSYVFYVPEGTIAYGYTLGQR